LQFPILNIRIIKVLLIYGELGRVPMSVHINARMIGFWARIVNGKKEKISRTL
jgi:hypothetical protein